MPRRRHTHIVAPRGNPSRAAQWLNEEVADPDRRGHLVADPPVLVYEDKNGNATHAGWRLSLTPTEFARLEAGAQGKVRYEELGTFDEGGRKQPPTTPPGLLKEMSLRVRRDTDG